MFKGIALSLTASSLFAVQYYLAAMIPAMDGYEIFGWRTLVSLPFMTLFMLVSGDWNRVIEIGKRVLINPLLLVGIIFSSILMTVQQWLFVWGPLNGRGLNVSLGYFLLPLVMLIVGRLFYKERLSGLKVLAAIAAAIGVLNALYQIGGFSWEALTVSIGLTLYFVLRRSIQTANLGGLWFDMLLMLPFALWCVWNGAVMTETQSLAGITFIKLISLGVISSVAFMTYISASRMLPFSVFGLLGYVEPVLLVVVALILGETIKPNEWPTYLAIWGAVLLLTVDGLVNVMKKRKR